MASDADRLELLLETFRRADGEKWALREIEQRTGGQASASYLSSIRAGRIKRVGPVQREALARVMCFPPELWDAEPERWPETLEEKRREAESGQAPPGPIAALLEDLFYYARHPVTGSPFTEATVAELAEYQITAEQVQRIRRGETVAGLEAKLLVLADVFGVPPSYWRGPRRVPALDEEIVRFLTGSERLRVLHMRLLELPETEREEIGDRIEQMLLRDGGPTDGPTDGQRGDSG